MAVALRSSVTAAPVAPPVPDRRIHLRAVPAQGLGAPPVAPAALVPAGASVHVLHPPIDNGAAAPLRLTRRGVAVLSVVVALACAALLAIAARSAVPQATRSAGHGAPSVVTVRSGDTLWSIALRVAPQTDPRAEVSVLQRRNHLSSERLVPGQRLHVR
jgi:nucleoid-associated protein YgaU